MPLAPFNEVYEAYFRVVAVEHASTMSGRRAVPFEDFEWQPLKLIQAYALAAQAIETGSVARTSHWARQTGASTTAAALVVPSDGVVVLQADIPAARHSSRRILNAFPEERENVRTKMGSGYHNKVWWTSDIEYSRRGMPRPELVVVDSEMAYVRYHDRETVVDDLARQGIAVLVLDSPKQPLYV